MKQTWENRKKLVWVLILAQLVKILVTNFFFQKSGSISHSLDIMVSYHHVENQKKLMTQHSSSLPSPPPPFLKEGDWPYQKSQERGDGKIAILLERGDAVSLSIFSR